MGDPPPYYILDPRRLLPASAAADWLGRIVTDFRDPLADFTPDKPQRFTDGLVDEMDAEDVHAQISSSQETSVSGALTEFVSVANGGGRSAGFGFQTGNMKTVRLRKYRDIFRVMREDPEVQKHLSRALRPGGPAAYMVVGLLVWTDASLSVTQERSRQHEVELQLPVLAVASAVAGIPPPVGIGDPAIATSSGNTRQTHLSMFVPGSYIFAVEYKAIRRKAYAILNSAKADWDGRGPRGKGDHHFNAHEEHDLAETRGEGGGEIHQDALVLDMDDDACVWYDTVNGLDVEELELQRMILAVEKS